MNIIKHITILLLTLLVLVSATGFKVEKFYCGTTLKSIHVFTAPTPCCSQPNTAKGSCSTELIYCKAEIDSESPPVLKEIIPQQQLVMLLAPVFQLFYKANRKDSIDFCKYKPPPLRRDIKMLVQSFLI